MSKYDAISSETQDEAMVIAKSTQRPGQTKEQTRLIALGIQKGIAEYKKSAKNKQRQADKAKKSRINKVTQTSEQSENAPLPQTKNARGALPWGLLITSWALFALYFFTQ
ncbi:DUF2956 domain-containing protein [Psychromonas sp. MME2]|uniref:DUF2956 domain-containing protein n=1 Tax=unclassified Psychromonas TaxID=2614957 RepID=UPI00339C5C66